jgi:hypothetical protein
MVCKYCEDQDMDEESRRELFSWLESLPQHQRSEGVEPIDMASALAGAKPATITKYSNASRVSISAGRLYGRWADTRGEACQDIGVDSWFFADDIIERPGPQSCWPATGWRTERVTFRVAPRSHIWDLTGNWICTEGCQILGGRAKIIQTGRSLQVWNEVGHSSNGFVEDADTIRVPGFTDATHPAPNGMRARVSPDGKELSWEGQTASRWVKDEMKKGEMSVSNSVLPKAEAS